MNVSPPTIPPRLEAHLRAHAANYQVVADAAPPRQAADPAMATVGVWVVAIGERYAMMVLPAGASLALGPLNAQRVGPRIRLASEAEIRHLFPGCDPAAVPPVGPLYGVPVYVSDALASSSTFQFHAGTPGAQLRVDRETFERLTQPHWITLPQETAA